MTYRDVERDKLLEAKHEPPLLRPVRVEGIRWVGLMDEARKILDRGEQ